MSIKLKDTIYDLINNADKLDNKHASDFATSGHTHNLGNKNAADLSSTYPSGISVGGIYNNGYPFAYGSTITASGNGGYFQIAGQWNSSVNSSSDYDYPTEMYIRGRRDSYDVWTTWSRVLTDRNYTNFAAKHDHTHSNYASKVTVGTTAYSCTSNNITIPAYPTIPTSLKCPNSLTIQGNGTNLGSYDGSAAKTINITYSNVGAAAASHSHDYAASSHSHDYAVQCGTVPQTGRVSKSGFYETSAATTVTKNHPFASTFMHFINCQHSNTANNYALQIAASFYDNTNFKIRVTNGSDATGWNTILHSGNWSSYCEVLVILTIMQGHLLQVVLQIVLIN